jgi:hypothetical protein
MQQSESTGTRPINLTFLSSAKHASENLGNEGHGFSRVPMSLRLTQGDENYSDFS